jgi:hypothetical protein
MIRKTKYVLIFLLTVILSDLSAQNSQVLYYMNIPQNHLLNPALRPSNSFYLGLPALTGINVNINNNLINFSDVIMPGKRGDSLITFLHPDYNVDNFVKKIKDRNFLAPEVSVQILGLGFNAGKDLYVFLDIIERAEGNIVLPGDLIKLALKGNSDFLGKTIDLSVLDGEFKYFREAGLGFSKNFTNKLRIGAKVKLLFGLGAASIDNRALGLTVNDDYSHTIDADLSLNYSAPIKTTVYRNSKNNIDSIAFEKKDFKWKDFFSNTSNIGLGLDLGATYKLSDKIMLSASITDLGYIKWKSDVTNLDAKSQFKFSGFSLTDVVNGNKTFDEVARDLADSLINSFTVLKNSNAFTTYLPVSISLGGSFNLTKSFALGILSRSIISGKQFREAVTVSANLNLGNAFSTSVSWTATNSRFDNLGFGLAFRPGIFQFYFIADRIPVTWNKIIVDKSTFPVPYNWNTINLRLGMNLCFGNRVKKKNDKPMLIEQK